MVSRGERCPSDDRPYVLYEVHDPLRLRSLARKNVWHNERAMPDGIRPCQKACMWCEDCVQSFRSVDDVFQHRDVIVYEGPGAVFFFTRGNILHGFFPDGKLAGKWRLFEEAMTRRMLGGGFEFIEGWVPEGNETLAKWLKRRGFEHAGTTRDRGFRRDGVEREIEVLTWDSSEMRLAR